MRALMLAVAVAVVPAYSQAAALSAQTLENAVSKAAEITKQAKALSAPKVVAASAGVAAALRLDASGSLADKEWRSIYTGQYEKCYSVRFSNREGVPGYPDSYNTVIYVYANGQHVANLVNPGDSTDVCGTKIQVNGYGPYGKGISFYYATERRP